MAQRENTRLWAVIWIPDTTMNRHPGVPEEDIALTSASSAGLDVNLGIHLPAAFAMRGPHERLLPAHWPNPKFLLQLLLPGGQQQTTRCISLDNELLRQLPTSWKRCAINLSNKNICKHLKLLFCMIGWCWSIQFQYHVDLLPPLMKVDGGYVFTPVCLSVSSTSQKVMDGFGQNLVDRLGAWRGRIDSILVKIWIQIWLISGIQNKLFSLAEICALLSAILVLYKM